MPSEYKPPEYKPPKKCLRTSISTWLIFGILRYVFHFSTVEDVWKIIKELRKYLLYFLLAASLTLFLIYVDKDRWKKWISQYFDKMGSIINYQCFECGPSTFLRAASKAWTMESKNGSSNGFMEVSSEYI